MTLDDFIWYLVDNVEKQQATKIQHVVLTGRHLDFVMSRHQTLADFAQNDGQFTLQSNGTDDTHPKPLIVSYSDHEMQDELYVYIAEDSDGIIASTDILYVEGYDEHLCRIIHRVEHAIKDNPSLFQHHSQTLKERFMAHINDLYDNYVPDTCDIRFVGYYHVEDDEIPLGRLGNGVVVPITSSDTALQLDADYSAVCVNGEYFVRATADHKRE